MDLQNTAFTCSPILSALLDEAVRSTAVYQQLGEKTWPWSKADTINPAFPRLSKALSNRIREEVVAALQDRLCDHIALPGAFVTHDPQQDAALRAKLKEELNLLGHHIMGVVDESDAPAFLVHNLPPGNVGNMAVAGLLAMAAHTQPGKMYFERIRRDNVQYQSQQPMHRDGTALHIGAMKGVAIGATALTTTFHDVNDIIDDVARNYRQFSGDQTPREAPVSEALQQEVTELLLKPQYSFKTNGTQYRKQAILVPEPFPEQHGRQWRLNRNFNTDDSSGKKVNAEDLAAARYLKDITPGDAQRQEWIAKALSKSFVDTMKDRDGLVIGPEDVVFYNDSLLVHGAGRIITHHPGTLKGQVRELLTIDTTPENVVMCNGKACSPMFESKGAAKA